MGTCFAAIILVSMYKTTVLDYINESVMYLPIFSIILTVLVLLETYEYKMEEIYYIADKSRVKTFIKRIMRIMLIEIIVIMMNLVLYLLFFDIGFEHDSSKWLYFEATILSMFMFVAVTSFLCALFKNKAMVLCTASLYWIYWICNLKESFFNPFIFVENPVVFEDYRGSQIIFIIFFVLIFFVIESKGPFWIKDKVRLIIGKKGKNTRDDVKITWKEIR